MPNEEEQEKYLPFAMKYLPDYYKEKARIELNETPERKIKGLEKMKKMASEHELTRDVQFVDDFLLQFLRHRKYDVSRAFQQLLNFTSIRKSHSSLFLTIDNDLFFSDPRRQFCTILPYRCPDGCTIALWKLGRWNPEEVSFLEFQQAGIIMFTQAMRHPMTQINGFKIIYDFQNMSLNQARYFTPSKLYLLYHGLMDCFPGRYKALHLVSESPIMRTLWTVARPFINHKMKQRVFFSSSRTDLLDHFPPSVLPIHYGGELEDYYMMEWTKEANRQQEGFTLRGQDNYC